MKAGDVIANAVSLAYCPCLGPKHVRIVTAVGHDYCGYVADHRGVLHWAPCSPCLARLARGFIRDVLGDAGS